jgi:hypothetical protein
MTEYVDVLPFDQFPLGARSGWPAGRSPCSTSAGPCTRSRTAACGGCVGVAGYPVRVADGMIQVALGAGA